MIALVPSGWRLRHLPPSCHRHHLPNTTPRGRVPNAVLRSCGGRLRPPAARLIRRNLFRFASWLTVRRHEFNRTARTGHSTHLTRQRDRARRPTHGDGCATSWCTGEQSTCWPSAGAGDLCVDGVAAGCNHTGWPSRPDRHETRCHREPERGLTQTTSATSPLCASPTVRAGSCGLSDSRQLTGCAPVSVTGWAPGCCSSTDRGASRRLVVSTASRQQMASGLAALRSPAISCCPQWTRPTRHTESISINHQSPTGHQANRSTT